MIKHLRPDEKFTVLKITSSCKKIFPFEIYTKENDTFFTEKRMMDFYNSDIIDRERQSYDFRFPSAGLFDPLNEKLFSAFLL